MSLYIFMKHDERSPLEDRSSAGVGCDMRVRVRTASPNFSCAKLNLEDEERNHQKHLKGPRGKTPPGSCGP